MQVLAVGFIRIYRYLISPIMPQCCRFTPSCSEYSIEAYRKYGFISGTLKSLWRVLRCNPFNQGGFDPLK